ncbi:MAG: SRPBCC family protein [Sediminibacterium magnilacihabitans]|jgi:hypothetical protein|nr:SRPBCC family protein [Sediminibacterium magnilacihabitans]PQV62084.1 polyketide cyclase/dehydrase/lipid transport protein [Sediminibacterium magnilacihabitans]
MTIEKEIIVNKDIESAWNVIGTQFADAYKWASPVNHSEGSGAGINGSTCSQRGCATTMGKLKEKILQYSSENHLISWQAVQGMPSMVKFAKNTWTLTSIEQNKTKVNMKMDIEVGGLMGFLMQPMMKMQMSSMGNTLTSDFKYYLEKGQPSPKKVKAMRKYKG